MMSSKFIIYAGRDFSADFTVISSDGVTGEVLDPLDTATISIITSGVNPVCVLDKIPMNIVDPDNGLFELTLTAAQTSELKQFVGFQEDGYSPIGNYNGFMDFALVTGARQAMITISVLEAPECLTAP